MAYGILQIETLFIVYSITMYMIKLIDFGNVSGGVIFSGKDVSLGAGNRKMDTVCSYMRGDEITDELYLRCHLNYNTLWETNLILIEVSEVEDLEKELKKRIPQSENLGTAVKNDKDKLMGIIEDIKKAKLVLEEKVNIKLPSELKIDNCVVIDKNDRKILNEYRSSPMYKPVGAENDNWEKELVFKGLSLTMKEASNDNFDFMSKLKDAIPSKTGTCVHCQRTSSSLDSYLYKLYDESQYNAPLDGLICPDCAREIRLNCAILSGNERVKRDIIVKSI